VVATARWSETVNDIYTDKLIRLSALDPEETGKAFANWLRDSEYMRLQNSSARSMASARDVTKFFEKEIEELSPAIYYFGARTLADDKLIGVAVLEIDNWSGRDAFVAFGIGERENWGRGYGTEMVKLLLQFAFLEINLYRVTLTVFEYNPRAIHTYEKAGFRHEGRMRKFLNKEGRRWDMLFMGILREEWMERNTEM
jgi:RimJ/RimL family protein N-acetyltransferase